MSIDTQFLNFKEHHEQYEEIDPKAGLKGTASGKVIFLSGASKGIGRATAIAFAQAGALAVYITGRSEDSLRETKKLVNEANPKTQCEYTICDVTDAEQVRLAVEDCVDKFGGIDVADANAGYLGAWNKIGESNIDSWWYSFEVNVKGVYNVVRYTIPHLIKSSKRLESEGKSGGHLILISSVGAQLVIPGASDYQTAKHAINRLCEFINVDHSEDGIKTFAVHPGGVATELAKNMPENMHAFLNDKPELAAGFIVWLCSGIADWATGRYLSSNWDVNELLEMKEEILNDDLLVNRLRTSG